MHETAYIGQFVKITDFRGKRCESGRHVLRHNTVTHDKLTDYYLDNWY